MGKLHTGLCVSFYTIYLHKYKGKLKCITAVDLKTTLDPSGKLPYIYGCYVTIWEPKVTHTPQKFMQTYAKMFA